MPKINLIIPDEFLKDFDIVIKKNYASRSDAIRAAMRMLKEKEEAHADL